jgi:hypothetical protein
MPERYFLLSARPILAVLLALAPMHAATSAEFRGEEINDTCLTSRFWVTGYVSGYIDKSHSDQHVLHTLKDKTSSLHPGETPDKDLAAYGEADRDIHGYCLPDRITFSQVSEMFCKYLRDNPAQRQKPATELLDIAMKQTWPCKG